MFEAVLEACNKVQIPKIIRWESKLETDQPLKVTVSVPFKFTGHYYFYGKMMKDGRIRIPKTTLSILKRNETSLAGYIFEVTIEPAGLRDRS